MIRSGSLEPGIRAADWRLPIGTALRYERPAEALQGLIADYAVADSDPAVFCNTTNWLLPGSARIWVSLTATDLQLKARARKPAPLTAMLVGPSSTAMPIVSNGGISVVIRPTPRGWARLFCGSAADMRDRVTLLDQHRPSDWTRDLVERLNASNRDTQVKGVLDTFLIETMPPPNEKEDLIYRIERLVAEVARLGDVSTWHDPAGLGSARTLARACNRYFGFSPKALQRRHRFLSAFTAMLLLDTPVDHRLVPPGYHDIPHFLRDARQLLGMTPRQFFKIPPAATMWLRATLRARQAVLGAPIDSLDSFHTNA